MRPGNRPDAIERIAHIGHPVAQRIVHRVLQRSAPGGDGNHLGPQKPHPEHVGGLTLHIMRAHVDHAFQPELGADGCGRHAMLPSPGFRDDPALAHAAGKDDLAQHVVDLMRAGMVQFIPLHIDLGAAQMVGQAFREIERRGAADIMLPQIFHLGPESRVGLGEFVPLFQFEDQRHQRFGNEAPPENPEAPLFIRACHEAVDSVLGHTASPCDLWQ